jgi:hypothetical protein
MSKPLNEDEKDELRALQCEGAQMVLFGLVALGEDQGGFQTELNGIVESLIVRRVTQLELEAWAAERAAAARQRGAARPRP